MYALWGLTVSETSFLFYLLWDVHIHTSVCWPKMESAADALILFTKVASIRMLNRRLRTLLKQRRRRLRNKARHCCVQRLDYPYFAHNYWDAELQHLRVFLTHGTQEMNLQCDVCSRPTSGIHSTDEVFHLGGQLITIAQQIADNEWRVLIYSAQLFCGLTVFFFTSVS